MEPVRDPEGVEIAVLDRLGIPAGRTVLEIGCGNGRLIWRYASRAAAVAGVDPDADRLAAARAAHPVALHTPLVLAQAQAEALPFADQSFECAILGWSL